MKHLIEAFGVLFVVIGPIDNAAVFAAFTKDYAPARRRRTALKSIIVATIVMLVFAVFGDDLLSVMGVTLSSLEIAGGILLLLAAIQMVMAELPAGKKTAEGAASRDIAIFPMAMPLIAGPDAIAAVVLLVSRAGKPLPFRLIMPSQIGVMLIMLFVLFLTYLALLGAGKLVKVLGSQGVEVVTRVLGLLLAALAVEFIVDGLAKSALFSPK